MPAVSEIIEGLVPGVVLFVELMLTEPMRSLLLPILIMVVLAHIIVRVVRKPV